MNCSICKQPNTSGRKTCGACRNRQRRERSNNTGRSERYCRFCNDYKAESEFDKNPDSASGFRSKCKECRRFEYANPGPVVNMNNLYARSEYLLRTWSAYEFINTCRAHYDEHGDVPYCWKVLSNPIIIKRAAVAAEERKAKTTPSAAQNFRVNGD